VTVAVTPPADRGGVSTPSPPAEPEAASLSAARTLRLAAVGLGTWRMHAGTAEPAVELQVQVSRECDHESR
jgi:hypothetical protein